MIRKGFTLVELLIVIAVLGTLAVVVLIALNPVQQLARTRDAGRSSTVAQLGRAMEARGTALGGEYPTTCGATSWILDCLVTPGEISTVPSVVPYNAGSASSCGGQNGFCFDATTADFVVYATAEADTNISQCTSGGTAYFVYSSAVGRGGLWCGGTPSAGVTSGFVQ